MATVKPHYFSRTAGDADDQCRRSRFYATIWGGRGLESTDSKEALDFGTVMHWMVQNVWEETFDEDQFNQFLSKFADGQRYIGYGLYRAYLRQYERYRKEGWKLLYAEKECQAQIGTSPKFSRPLLLLAQPDLLLIHEPTGVVRYVEIKTTKLLTQEYFESWRYAPQLAAGFEAVWQTLGIKVDEFVMQLLYKGSYYKDEQRWASPFTSAWFLKSAEAMPITPETVKTKRPSSWKGWERVDTNTRYTPEDWLDVLEKIEPTTLDSQVPETPPLIFDEKMVSAWLQAKARREGEIADAVHRANLEDTEPWEQDDILDSSFPQNFLKCRPPVGIGCPFLSLCWNPMEGKNPLQSGKYRLRIPHHKTEKEALGV